jgi:hypothetical protein
MSGVPQNRRNTVLVASIVIGLVVGIFIKRVRIGLLIGVVLGLLIAGMLSSKR